MTNVDRKPQAREMDGEVSQGVILKRPRTSEDFYLFCKFILEHENYEVQHSEVRFQPEAPHTAAADKKKRPKDVRNQSTSPPLDSSGSSINSDSMLMSSHGEKPSGDETDNDLNDAADLEDSNSYDSITCFCSKPFAGRPMIECSACYTWIHLSCAKIRKNNIPEFFYCAMCKDKDASGSMKGVKGTESSNGLESPPMKRLKRGVSLE